MFLDEHMHGKQLCIKSVLLVCDTDSRESEVGKHIVCQYALRKIIIYIITPTHCNKDVLFGLKLIETNPM